MTSASSSNTPLLTSEAGLKHYLEQQGRTPAYVQALGGGTANYVYRVQDANSSNTTIYKHAAAYLSSNNAFAFSSARMNYEAHALKNISSLQDSSIEERVHAVKVIEYDEDAKLLAIEDGGARNLKEACSDASLDIREIGYDLATWLATLHSRSRDFSLVLPHGDSSSASVKGNNPIAVAIYRHSYRNLHTALAKFGYDTAIAERIDDKYGSLLAQDDECLLHGDHWPGNVLVKTRADAVPRAGGEVSSKLTIVDWEMVRRGTSATDVGQFAAEAFLLDRLRGDRGLRRAFLARYIQMRKDDPIIGREWLKCVAVHWAVHIAFWPTRVDWTDQKGTQELVDIGVEVLKAVLDGDVEFLKTSKLFGDLGGEVAEALGRP
ncbi:kinase-like protein [Setomelanomma holmii]|uniref:Kinase-like protein n=1 Tax=Setomelanomma holmii TaxID=210430 RepID=A0A9P4HCV2_9PLEO|nr:kinase-like protein [Setomelanomma holmii]